MAGCLERDDAKDERHDDRSGIKKKRLHAAADEPLMESRRQQGQQLIVKAAPAARRPTHSERPLA